MQRLEEHTEGVRGGVFITRRPDRGRLTREPRAHAPCPWKAAARPPETDRCRDREREPRRELGEPTLLVQDEGRRHEPARQADQQVGAEAEHDVVPAVDRVGECEPGEVTPRARNEPGGRHDDVAVGIESAGIGSVLGATPSVLHDVPGSAAGQCLGQVVCSSWCRSRIVSCGCDHNPSFEPLNVISWLRRCAARSLHK